MRRSRRARLEQILAGISTHFADPALSVGALADRLGLSVRYVQKLFGESGPTFTARVRELRLNKARVLLSDPANTDMPVSEIALACGFNEVSYFNRCFRRRFGTTPTQFRELGMKCLVLAAGVASAAQGFVLALREAIPAAQDLICSIICSIEALACLAQAAV